MNKRKTLGFRPEYLGAACGRGNDGPLGMIVLRPIPEQDMEAVTFMFDRATLERMREDIDYLLSCPN